MTVGLDLYRTIMFCAALASVTFLIYAGKLGTDVASALVAALIGWLIPSPLARRSTDVTIGRSNGAGQ
jgi:hypothetical protein